MGIAPSTESLGTVQRVAEVLRFFSERGSATLKEMSQALSLAPSTCHRLCELLSRDGLIEKDEIDKKYKIGRELFRISALVNAKNDLRSLSIPFLEDLSNRCNETAVLSVFLPRDCKVFFAERADSTRMLRYQLPMNLPMSPLWGASGRSILAFLDSSDLDRALENEERAPASGERPPSRKSLEKQLAIIRDRGFDLTFGQKIVGAVGIAAPVFSANGKVVGSVCLTVPESRVNTRNQTKLGAMVQNSSAALSTALGFTNYSNPRRKAATS
ncbi:MULTISPECIES: IclR family transcriptional regulator [unclassified Beijerinckia]|uniref:IclR family transcriptional regulator n=1 Tax=unclassified Beijerinckia TaxID=2638183 RepID=UPI000896449A|nr:MULTISPECIES: IclR family transcriptional regulator [unclassified Beijerinckia]MDH7799262.1 DNA-binding IclR family transcriptional regulator [Beijerinckia sp. GAS462]SED90381.1 transcriptional regulator, IclR family [Beijerinckia sp. 28-YEA-48]